MLPLFLPLLLLLLGSNFTTANDVCGDWEMYKDEKCVKIIDETHTYEEALRACASKTINASSHPTLLVIHSAEEQAFMSNLIFNVHRIVDTIWIGAKMADGGKFKWMDDSQMDYSNWAKNNPTNKSDRACVEMIPEPEQGRGTWADEPCNKKNLVICQRMQSWSLEKMQQNFLNSRKVLQDQLAATQKALQDQIEAVKRAPPTVPIGFTYVQLPKEKAPTEVFPGLKFTDVSADYAGIFFRVLGGGAGNFTQIQEENAPHLSQVTFQGNPCDGATATLAKGAWSGTVLSAGGYAAGALKNCHKFMLSPGEVRPRNMAVKVWRRTG